MTELRVETILNPAARDLLDRARSIPERGDAVMDAIGFAVAERSRGGIFSQRDPWGRAYEPLAESTLERRRKSGEGAQALLDTGVGVGSINHEVEPGRFAVQIGPGVRYMGIHQFGTESAGRGRRTKIPARPFLPIRDSGAPDLPPDWEAEIEREMVLELEDLAR